jgi:hypothetical protein
MLQLWRPTATSTMGTAATAAAAALTWIPQHKAEVDRRHVTRHMHLKRPHVLLLVVMQVAAHSTRGAVAPAVWRDHILRVHPGGVVAVQAPAASTAAAAAAAADGNTQVSWVMARSWQ